MKNNEMHNYIIKDKIFSILFTILGLLILANALYVATISNMNSGIIVTAMLGAFLLVYGIFLNFFKRTIPKCIRYIFYTGLVLMAFVIPALIISGTTDTVTYEEDAIIVLGAAVYGEEPSGALKARLNSAIEYHSKNPDAFIVVSGGKGPQEDISEALAMERYLMEHGISQDKIIKEDQSTSTYENFKYSKEILDQKLGDTYDVAYITNDYHTFRAGCLANLAGFKATTHAHSKTTWFLTLPSCIRESMAIVKMWLFKN